MEIDFHLECRRAACSHTFQQKAGWVSVTSVMRPTQLGAKPGGAFCPAALPPPLRTTVLWFSVCPSKSLGVLM